MKKTKTDKKSKGKANYINNYCFNCIYSYLTLIHNRDPGKYELRCYHPVIPPTKFDPLYDHSALKSVDSLDITLSTIAKCKLLNRYDKAAEWAKRY